MNKKIYFDRLNSLRGLFALEIIIGHVVRSEATILFLLGKFMIVSVAFFFFMLGFGLVWSYEMKDEYLKGFLTRKIKYFFLIAVVTMGVNIMIDAVYKGNLGYYPIEGNVILWFAQNTNWYLFEQGLFYILFYIAFRYIKKYSALFILITTILLATFVFLAGWTEMWYASSMGFPAGILFGRYFVSIMNFLKSIWGKLITVLMTMLGLTCLVLDVESLISMVYLRNIMCIACLLILIYFVGRYNFDNKVNRFLLSYSTEMYLFQFVWLKLTENYGLRWQLRLPVVIVCTALTASIMHPVFDRIKKSQNEQFMKRKTEV